MSEEEFKVMKPTGLSAECKGLHSWVTKKEKGSWTPSNKLHCLSAPTLEYSGHPATSKLRPSPSLILHKTGNQQQRLPSSLTFPATENPIHSTHQLLHTLRPLHSTPPPPGSRKAQPSTISLCFPHPCLHPARILQRVSRYQPPAALSRSSHGAYLFEIFDCISFL